MLVRSYGGREPLNGQRIRETTQVKVTHDVWQGVLALTHLVPSVSSYWRRWLAVAILRHRGPHCWFKKALLAAGPPVLTLRQLRTWYSHLNLSLLLPADEQHAASLLRAAADEIAREALAAASAQAMATVVPPRKRAHFEEAPGL